MKDKYLWAVNVAIIGAFVYSWLAIYSLFTGHMIFRGAWALSPFVAYPWFIMMGALLSQRKGVETCTLRCMGIVAALLSLAYLVGDCFPFRDSHDYVNNDLISIRAYVLLPLSYISIGYYYFATKEGVCFTWKKVVATIAACVLYLVCQYYLRGWTTRNIGLPLWTFNFLRVGSFLGMTVFCLSIVDACRSDLAIKLISIKWLRIILVVVCSYLWLRYTMTGFWTSHVLMSLFHMVNPLTCGAIATAVILIKKDEK